MNALAPKPAVCQVTTADGTVLLDAEHGRLFGLNPAGSAVWEGLAAGQSTEEITANLAARFDAPVERIHADVEALVGQLRDRGLLDKGGAPR